MTKDKGRKYLLLALLYFSEGAPIGYIWWALPAKLSDAGMPVERVAALTALLAVPWTFKFLWAPAVDALQTPGFGLRGWITVMQVLMGLTLLPLAVLPMSSIIVFATGLLLVHAICAATQDVAIDAFAVGILAPDERGRANGWMQTGYFFARAIFGGLVLYVEQFVGERAVIIALIAAVWLALLALWTMRVPPPVQERIGGGIAQFGRHLLHAVRSRRTWIGIAIAVTAGAGFEAVGGLTGPLLIDAGMPLEQVGLYRALPVVGCTIAGVLLGGYLADRFGPRQLTAAGIVSCGCVIAALALVVHITPNDPWFIAGVIAAVYLGIGVLTAASYALLMNLTDPAIAGTQFSTFMGATNFCEVWAVALAGYLAASSYPLAFLLTTTASLLALPLLLLLPKESPP